MINPAAYGYAVWKCPLCQQVILVTERDSHQELTCPVVRERVVGEFAAELERGIPASWR
ncbi:MAG: hypothetical protein ACRDZ4_04695 [Egibacteraceae bacterium]